jgi:acetoacetyl-CoA synthetase
MRTLAGLIVRDPPLYPFIESLLIPSDVWTHGDFVAIQPITKQIVFHGRADGVLNPSGVRFGSAEIYRVIEGHFPQEIADSICVGQRRPSDTDERVMLFLLMKPGASFTADLVTRVKSAIRKELSARHVPAFIFETPEIPVSDGGPNST